MTNLLFLIGRITKDLEIRRNGESSLCRIPIAVQNGKDDTTFIDVTAFGKTAETANEYCRKGDLIGIKGMIRNNNWTDEKGNKHYDYSFIARQITFLSASHKQETNNEDPFKDFGEQVTIDDNFLD